MTPQTDFEDYRQEWLSDVKQGNPSTSELGHRFARKLITQWLDVDEASDDIVYCDGAGDGGIDIAFLNKADTSEGNGEAPTEGDVWYLVQSKYGKAFQGIGTLLEESQKVFSTLDGQRSNLSSLAQGLLERLKNFKNQASELDRLILVFATEEPLTDSQKRALDDIRAMGRNRLGPLFDVESVSIATIFQRLLDNINVADSRTEIILEAKMALSGQDLLVGSISLLNLYKFLKDYRSKVGDLDQLYEKNVRRFLGNRGKVNKAMQQTLKLQPDRFGLYNNGITLVVESFRQENNEGAIILTEPYVVNGCQTTRTVWEVIHQQLEAGGTGTSIEMQNWRSKAEQGVVIAKIVKVGATGDNMLQDITRYTNSQNAVKEKDFLALTSDFRTMAREMADKYNVFLETQRGGWESQKAYQHQHPNSKQFVLHTNAFDLLKVYGAGWLKEPGTAYGRNASFLPNGSVFKKIFSQNEEPFSVDDFYAAFKVQQSADELKFGRGAEKNSRRQTRFLFYMIVLELLSGLMASDNLEVSPKGLTNALLKLYKPVNAQGIQAVIETAIDVIDEYGSAGAEESVTKEPAFQNTFNNDLNAYLKWEQLSKTDEASPNLRSLIAITRRTLGRGTPSPKEFILNSIRQA